MRNIRSLAAVAALLAGTPALATTAVDPSDDFLATYTGPQLPELDILSVSARRDATSVSLSATLAGAVGGSPGAIYVWGINRGAGTARLTLGAPSVGAGILFDSVFVMFPDGLGRVVTFPAAGAPTITNLPGAITVDGDTISGSIPFALLPSRGFDPADYGYSMWVRQRANPLVDGTNIELADFAPDASSFTASVPEPASWTMMIAGFGFVGGALRRQDKRTGTGVHAR
jgi:hypothetical protein